MLSEIKITEMLRADRTRISAALYGAGELKAHQRSRTVGQRRYTLTMVCNLTGPESDPLQEGEDVLRSRLPEAVLEMSKLWEEEGQLKVAYTFTPSPSTDQIVLVTINHEANFTSLKDAGAYLAQLPPEMAHINISFRSTSLQSVEPLLLLALGGSTEQDLRLMLLGRNIY